MSVESHCFSHLLTTVAYCTQCSLLLCTKDVLQNKQIIITLAYDVEVNKVNRTLIRCGLSQYQP